jgi:hypothetical protein
MQRRTNREMSTVVGNSSCITLRTVMSSCDLITQRLENERIIILG